MKTKMKIENGKTTVILTPENESELNIIDQISYKNIRCEVCNKSSKVIEDKFIYLMIEDKK